MTKSGWDEPCIKLGLSDGPAEEEEEIDLYSSRLGGRPTFIFPTVRNLQCELCNSPLYLVLQMDCPLNVQTKAGEGVDRILYVFICNSRECTEAPKGKNRGAVQVFFQCRRIEQHMEEQAKAFWRDDDEGDGDGEDEDEDDYSGPEAVAKGVANLDLDTSQQTCYTDGFIFTDSPSFKPTIALRIVDELVHSYAKPTKMKVEPNSSQISASSTKDKSWLGEVYEQTRLDKCFQTFNDRVTFYPRQLVRYNPGGAPLPFHSTPWPTLKPCPRCQQELRFELQLMPAILSFLPVNQDRYLTHIPADRRNQHPLFTDGMEWGTILVFTCGKCPLERSLSESTFEIDCHYVIQTELELSS